MKNKALLFIVILITSLILSCQNILEYQLDIISFNFEEVKSYCVIKEDKITVYVPSDTDITNLKPNIVLSSSKLSITPNSGVVQDFTKDITYTVTSTSGSQKSFIVHVEKTDTVLLNSIYITGQKNSTFIQNNIYITMPYNTDLSSLQLCFETADNVQSNLKSGECYNFFNPIKLELTHQYIHIIYTIYVYTEKWELITNNPGFNSNDGAGLLFFKNNLNPYKSIQMSSDQRKKA